MDLHLCVVMTSLFQMYYIYIFMPIICVVFMCGYVLPLPDVPYIYLHVYHLSRTAFTLFITVMYYLLP